MKNYFLICTVCLAMVSCQSSNDEASVSAGNTGDSLLAVKTPRVSTATEYLRSMEHIKRTIDTIEFGRKTIYLKTADNAALNEEMISGINKEISQLNTLLKNSKARVEQLNKKLEAEQVVNDELKDSIQSLNRLLVARESQLLDLGERLLNLDDDFTEVQVALYLMYVQNAFQNRIIVKDIKAAFTAFYITGTKKELLDEHIIDQKGGLLGIGANSTLSEEANSKKFTKIDYREEVIIPLDCKRATLVTTHPANSYRMEKDKKKIRRLIILDPIEFWSLSKYLVIVKD